MLWSVKREIPQPINKQVGAHDACREQSEVLWQDFIELFNCLNKLEAQFFISGPLPTVSRGINKLSLNTWLSKTCGLKGISYIDN